MTRFFVSVLIGLGIAGLVIGGANVLAWWYRETPPADEMIWMLTPDGKYGFYMPKHGSGGIQANGETWTWDGTAQHWYHAGPIPCP